MLLLCLDGADSKATLRVMLFFGVVDVLWKFFSGPMKPGMLLSSHPAPTQKTRNTK